MTACKECGHRIDPEICWCGSDKDGHPHELGHNFVPMGCTCGYDTRGGPR